MRTVTTKEFGLQMIMPVCALLALMAGTALCQSEPFLDVTKLSVPRQDDGRLGSAGGGSECLIDGPEPCVKPLPIKVTLLRLDKESYSWEEPLLLEIRLENVGDKPVAIPWTVDWRLRNRSKATANSLLVASVAPLRVHDPSGKSKDLANQRMFTNVAWLYGSTDVPGTFITLPSGGTARIRTPGKIVFPGRDSNFPFDMLLRAGFSFNKGFLSNNYSDGVSVNAVTIKVTSPR